MLSVDRILLLITVVGLLACAVGWLLCGHCVLGSQSSTIVRSTLLQPAVPRDPCVHGALVRHDGNRRACGETDRPAARDSRAPHDRGDATSGSFASARGAGQACRALASLGLNEFGNDPDVLPLGAPETVARYATIPSPVRSLIRSRADVRQRGEAPDELTLARVASGC